MNKPSKPATFIAASRDSGDNSIRLTPELLEMLGAKEGDEFEVHQSAQGPMLRKRMSDFDRKMSIVDRIMEENRDVLAALAK